MTGDQIKDIVRYLDASIAVQREVAAACAVQILAVSKAMAAAFKAGRKVLLCGNGGSAADCQHMAAELVSRISAEMQRPGLPAIALTTDTSFLTAYGNDFGFGGVFERQVNALGNAGDVLVVISTSGRSENVRRAVRSAKAKGMITVGLLGEGGPLTAEVEHAIVVPNRNAQHVQEALLPIEHIVCLLIEHELFGHQNPGSK